ncbi:MAG: site-2 protease family protein [Nanoarchaeota archaeon]|nr:site-2 protease family protein [Nanoarchaeota archaeon]
MSIPYLLTFLNFLLENIWVILFYSFIIVWIYRNREKFEFQAKIIALYRTAFGIDFLDRFSKKHKELIILLGYVGVGLGFVGMIYISGVLIDSFMKLFLQPDAPATFTPAIPGVKIPGSQIFIPFWYGIIALFLTTVVHEAAHGLVARAHGLKVKSTGFGMIGPLPIAFVEPDEKQVRKQKDIVQYSIFAAGPFSNMLFAGLVLLLMIFAVSPMLSNMVETDGFSFYSITPYSPAFNASVPANVLFTHLNDVKIDSEKEFYAVLDSIKAGEAIRLRNEYDSFEFSSVENPNNPGKALMGISAASNSGSIVQIHKSDALLRDDALAKAAYFILKIFYNLFFWIFLLSSGIGIANLLPLGPVDGGRMLQIVTQKLVSDSKKANEIWAKISVGTFVLVLITFFVPIIKAILAGFGINL